MNRFGFLAENIRPLGSGRGSTLFSDALMTRDEKKAMFGSKRNSPLSAAQKAHQKKVKEVGKLRKQGYTLKEAWKIVKSGKKTGVKKPSKTVKRKATTEPRKTKPRKVKRVTSKRRPSTRTSSSKDLTPAQKRAKRAMKLAHTKYGGDLAKAWKEIKKEK